MNSNEENDVEPIDRSISKLYGVSIPSSGIIA